jgi:hypothetical protein
MKIMHRLVSVSLFLVVLLVASRGFSADDDSAGILPVWDMNRGLLNAMGGIYNHFQAGDSTASVHLTPEQARGASGRSMKIDYTKSDSGYCGVWTHLYPENNTLEALGCPDIADYPYLSFFVKGKHGGEDFTVQLADPSWIAREDSSPAGLVSRYLGSPITTNWSEVVIPIKDFRLPSFEACGITFNFTRQGAGTVYIDDLSFKSGKDTPVPVSQVQSDSAADRPIARAMWVWHTRPLLLDPDEQHAFFEFCQEYGITEIFLQVLCHYTKEGTDLVTCLLEETSPLRSFLERAHARGLVVHALDGHPEYVLRRNHAKVLSQVNALIEFNRAGKPQERFDAIHLDNEPYLLPGFETPLQAEILNQYLTLNAAIMARLDETDSDMALGVDIPFWLDERPGQCPVSFNDETRPAMEQIIDLVDNVGIMDYRNFAGGADGIITHGQGEIAYANLAGKPIYLGVETYQDSPMPYTFVPVATEEDWPAFAENNRDIMLRSTIDGLRMRQGNAAGIRWLGLQHPATDADQAVFAKNLEHLKAISTCRETVSRDSAHALVQSMKRDPAYTQADVVDSTDDSSLPMVIGYGKMPDKTTFAGQSKADLNTALDEVITHFRADPSFHGIAIHYYRTYRDMP